MSGNGPPEIYIADLRREADGSWSLTRSDCIPIRDGDVFTWQADEELMLGVVYVWRAQPMRRGEEP